VARRREANVPLAEVVRAVSRAAQLGRDRRHLRRDARARHRLVVVVDVDVLRQPAQSRLERLGEQNSYV